MIRGANSAITIIVIIKRIHCSTPIIALLCMLGMILTGCTNLPVTTIPGEISASAPMTSAYWPTEGWRTSSPEEQGMDSQKLAQMLDAIQEQRLNLHSLLIFRNGYLVSENYFGSYRQDTRHEIYSCTKSFVATLIGIAIDKGYLDGTDQRIIDYFPELTIVNLDAQKEGITMEILIVAKALNRESCEVTSWMGQSKRIFL